MRFFSCVISKSRFAAPRSSIITLRSSFFFARLRCARREKEVGEGLAPNGARIIS
jgi:hypothetical protein